MDPLRYTTQHSLTKNMDVYKVNDRIVNETANIYKAHYIL